MLILNGIERFRRQKFKNGKIDKLILNGIERIFFEEVIDGKRRS